MTTYTVAQVLSAAAQGLHLDAAAILDTSANVAANLDALEPLSTQGNIGSITFTDSAPIVALSATQYLSTDGAVVAEFQGSFSIAVQNASVAQTLQIGKQPHVSIVVTDTDANIVANLDALNGIYGSISYINANTVTGYYNMLNYYQQIVAPTLTPLQLVNDLHAIALLRSLAGTIDVSGQVSMATAIAAEAVNPYFTAITVVDSAADIQAALSANLAARPTIIASGAPAYQFSISLTDLGTPTVAVSYANYNVLVGNIVVGAGGAAALSTEIMSPHLIDWTSVPVAAAAAIASTANSEVSVADIAANVQAGIDGLETLALDGTLKGITITGVAQPTFTAAQQKIDAAAIQMIATGNAVASSYTIANAVTAYQGGTLTSTIAISDTAANVAASLDTLQGIQSGIRQALHGRHTKRERLPAP